MEWREQKPGIDGASGGTRHRWLEALATREELTRFCEAAAVAIAGVNSDWFLGIMPGMLFFASYSFAAYRLLGPLGPGAKFRITVSLTERTDGYGWNERAGAGVFSEADFATLFGEPTPYSPPVIKRG